MLKILPGGDISKIRYAAVHHVGGLLNNPFYSSLNMTAEQIDKAHRDRWDFKSQLQKYGGYNAFIDVAGNLMQFRYILEETAAQKGHNFDTISIALAGNFTIDPTSGRMIDQPTPAQLEKLGEVMDWINKNTPVATPNIVAHRFLGWTECYGTGLTDSWCREVMIDYRNKKEMKQRIGALQRLILLYSKLIDLLRISKMRIGARFGSQPLYHIGLCEAERG